MTLTKYGRKEWLTATALALFLLALCAVVTGFDAPPMGFGAVLAGGLGKPVLPPPPVGGFGNPAPAPLGLEGGFGPEGAGFGLTDVPPVDAPPPTFFI